MTIRPVAGLRTRVTRFGAGPRAALAIHCSLAHSGAWAGVAARLEERLTITAFDLPGHGGSADCPAEAEPHALATAIAAELAKAEAPVDLIGHSYGGTVALRLALERPELVRSLALVEPVLFAAAGPVAPALLEAQRARHEAMQAALAADAPEAAARIFLDDWGAEGGWNAVRPDQRARMLARLRLIPLANRLFLDDGAGMLAPGRLEGLDRPVVLIDGANSPAIIGAIAEGLARRLPQATRLTVPGAGHMVPVTHPAAVADAVAALLDTSRKAPAGA